MQSLSALDVLLLFVFSVSCAVGAILLLGWFDRRKDSVTPTAEQSKQSVVWLFQKDELIDATDAAAAIVGDDSRATVAWAEVAQVLGDRFPGIPLDINDVSSTKMLSLPSQIQQDDSHLTLEKTNKTLRVELFDRNSRDVVCRHNLVTLSREHAFLNDCVSGSPSPAWRTGKNGNLIWTNRAYDQLFASLKSPNPSARQAKPLFDPAKLSGNSNTKVRMSLTDEQSNRILWFDVVSVPVGDQRMNYATDINAVVSAEIAQRNFVQTLAKTFAQLSTGLAIFDRKRQLVLFNPALIDLTSLPADFLSARPNLLSFFDRLRDARMMPEPKNYSSWRERIAEVVTAAADGRYQETWTLSSGSTYRVTGRPHPDGAVAFLIEDVSAEVSLTRRFRSQLEVGQSVIDQQEEAVAVFSSLGVLTLSNAPYTQLWGIDPENSFAEMTVLDATRHWQAKCKATPVWSKLRDYVVEFGERAEWFADVEMKDGKALRCRFTPIAGGATLASFRLAHATALLPHKTVTA